MKLYDLTSEYQVLLDVIEEQGGELTEEQLNALDATEGAFAEKVDSYAAMIRTLQHQADAYYSEEQRLNNRRASLENNIKSLKVRLQANMARLGLDHVKGPRFSVRLQATESVEITNETIIPPQYVVMTSSPSKTLISEALKSGVEVPGCKLTKSESVRIR